MNTKNYLTPTKKYKSLISSIHSIFRLVNSTYELKNLISRLAKLFCQIFNARYCLILLLDPTKKYSLLKCQVSEKKRYLIDKKDTSILDKLSKSSNLWERRIAIVSTFHFIKNNQFADTLKISEILLEDKHDLIRKAAGWMLREVGKRNNEILENFLKKNYKNMPRTMLRYAIERFPEDKRKAYLRGEI